MIFGSIETIYNLDNTLVQEFRQRIYDRFLSPSVGDIFTKMGPIFKLYEQYTKENFEAVHYFKKLQKTNIQLFTIIQRLQSESKSTPLLTLLELPCKRLVHYKTIMSGLLKCTSEEHLDYIFLKDAIVKVDNAIDGVKIYQYTIKEIQVVREMEDRIENLPNNLIPLSVSERNFVDQFELYQIDDIKKPKNRSKYYFFLFSDILIKTKFDKKKYLFQSFLNINGAFINEFEGNNIFEKDSFQIIVLNETLTLAVLDPNLKDNCIKSFKKALENSHLVDTQKKNQSRTSIYKTKLECVSSLFTQELFYLPKKTTEIRQKKKFDSLLEILGDYDFFSRGIINLNNKAIILSILKVLEAKLLFFPLLTKFVRFDVHMISEKVALDSIEDILKNSNTSFLIRNLNEISFTYHQSTLKPFILEIIDKAPSENWQIATHKQSAENIRKMCENVLNKILSSSELIASQFKEILKIVKFELDKKFSGNNKINTLNIISSITWQQIFEPVFLQPLLYHITDKEPSGKHVNESLKFFCDIFNHVFSGVEFKNIPNLQPLNEIISNFHDKTNLFVNSLINSVQFSHNHASFCLNKEINQDILPFLFLSLYNNVDIVIESIKKNQTSNQKKLVDQFINSLANIKAHENI